MKLTPLFLIGSLAANAALFVVLTRRDAAPPPAPSVRAAPDPAPVPTPKVPSATLLADLGRKFADLPPDELRTQLQALDLPRNIVDQLVHARITAHVRARSRELAAEALKTAPTWKLANLRADRFALLTPEQRKELRDLEADARNETLRLLGPSLLDRDGTIAFKYGFVPPDKAVLLDALVRDYENLGTQLKDETRYLKTPADKDREKLLRDEQARDLAALLSPAELDGFEMRASSTAQTAAFQSLMRAFQPTEAEYRALFAIQKTADANREAGIAPPPQAPRAPLTGATMSMINGNSLPEAEVRAALGDVRFADWQAASQPHYQSLARLAAGTDIAPATVRQVSLLVDETTAASWRIAEDTTLTGPQKKAALADLAATARTQITAQLPATVAETFLKTGRWFEALSTGSAVRIEGPVTSFRPVDPQPAKATPGR